MLATYIREDVPVDVEEVATEEKARKWEHLKVIKDKLPTETNMEIGWFIGANCLKALEPEEVLPSKDSGPFAFRTPLEWSVVGLLTRESWQGKFNLLQSNCCTRCSCKKNSIPSFGISSKVKDINAKQMLENMYNTEFCESRLRLGIEASNNMEDISFEDQKFLILVDEKLRKVGEHFEIPLPLRDRSVKLPNNRNMAEKRLHCLKSRFIRNPEFFADYKGFVEDLLIKGYAKKQQKNHLMGGHGTFPIIGSITLTGLRK